MLAQASLADGTTAFTAVINIPHSERHGLNPYVRVKTANAEVTATRLLHVSAD